MAISKICIENIRGFENVTLNISLRPNCTNILVAPNGFGKSSISTAFNCARGNTLKVDEKHKHKQQEFAKSKLIIEFNGHLLEADDNKNDISRQFDVHVVKSNVEPKAKLPKINGYTVAKPYMEIPDLDLGPVFQKENLNYDIEKYKSLFGINSKVVPNIINRCDNDILKNNLFESFSNIGKLAQKRSLDLLNEIIDFVKNTNGTKASINAVAKTRFGASVNSSPHIKLISEIVSNSIQSNSWLDNIIICYQLMDLHESDKSNLKKWLQYAIYSMRIRSIKDFISDINGAWVSASVKETRGRVIINFPDAASLSNGQRDLLYFGCNLLRTRETTSKKPCIFVIDEVFDYLDDANIIVAQYFLSKMIDYYKEEGREVYICLLTHLDPLYFKGYALKKQQTIYLANTPQKVTDTMRKVISDRDNPIWANEISRYFLHYYPNEYDLSEIFNANFGLPKRNGKSHEFYNFLKGEWDKCVTGIGSYDPFAVCAYVRVQIERCAYEKIQEQANQDTFLLNCNGTAKKLEFAESIGVAVPEVCLLLGVVYNDALHRKGALDQSSTIALKLKNLGLQSMMKKAINW
ncbi:hypothetical protein J2848_006672 [Azospirillum lipoferum]|uniref:ATP-binding protein n=1 Tax=Azospirillum lipoferum TaxID=193 RepID=A0A5A9G7D1_AZOLI|nr:MULTISPECIES: AAA family ATPase [Azospirillum]KAA0590286.1 ATP-binding protein [Azospirillum lipoferum]MCP1614959.1 hypothetical protein [Azospirillum lipoferum]MDW5532496.1 AAA family ATPase [Azospirillum sp. NL1]